MVKNSNKHYNKLIYLIISSNDILNILCGGSHILELVFDTRQGKHSTYIESNAAIFMKNLFGKLDNFTKWYNIIEIILCIIKTSGDSQHAALKPVREIISYSEKFVICLIREELTGVEFETK
jgi:hypothetical protein